MVVKALIFSLFAFIYGLFQKKKLNPYTVFYGLWVVIIFLSSLNLYSLIPANEQTYYIILVGLIAFFIGLFIMNIIYKFKSKKNKVNKYEYKLNYRLLYILSILCIVVYLIDFGKSFSYLMEGYKLSYIRQLAQQGFFYQSSIINMLKILIVYPFTNLLSFLLPTDIFYGRKDKKLIIFTLINILLRVFTDGSRSCIIWLIFSLVICYAYRNIGKKKEIKKQNTKTKKIVLIIFFVFLVGLLYYVTMSRSGEDTLRFTYYDFAMEPIMFEKWMHITDYSHILGYGLSSLNGFFFAIFYIFTNIFKMFSYPTKWLAVYNLLEGVGTNWQTITYFGTKANSYASVFLTFYIDWKINGVMLGMLLYGIFVGYFYNKVLLNFNQNSISKYIFILIGLFYTFIQFPFRSIYNAITFIMLLLIVFKKIKIRSDN